MLQSIFAIENAVIVFCELAGSVPVIIRSVGRVNDCIR